MRKKFDFTKKIYILMGWGIAPSLYYYSTSHMKTRIMVAAAVMVCSLASVSVYATTSLDNLYTVTTKDIGAKSDEAFSSAHSPDGTSYTYITRGTDGQGFVVKDGFKMGPYDGTIGGLIYSPDGKSVAFSMQKDGKSYIARDGVTGAPYDSVNPPLYSPNGKSLAYVARKNGFDVIVKDGVESSPYDSISALTYSPDSKRFAFEAMSHGKWMVVVDEREGKEYSEIDMGIVFSPDNSGFFAYSAVDGQKHFIVRNGVEGKAYETSDSRAYIDAPIYSPDAKNIAYTVPASASPTKKALLVKDGIETNTKYDAINQIAYSPSGSGFTFVGQTGDTCYVVRDGVESSAYDAAPFSCDFTYSPDGKSLAFQGKKGSKWDVVKDGVASKSYDSILQLVYSPDGKSFAFGGYKGGSEVVVKDGVEMTGYDNAAFPVYSPDSKSFTFQASRNSKWFVVKDGAESALYDSTNDPAYSSDSSSLSFEGERDGKRYIVTYSLKKDASVVTPANTTGTGISTKTAQAIHTLADKINKLPAVKRVKYRKQIGTLLAKLDTKSLKYQVLNQLLSEIQTR